MGRIMIMIMIMSVPLRVECVLRVPDRSLPVQARAAPGSVTLVGVGADDVLLPGRTAISAPGVDSARSQALRRGDKGIKSHSLKY